MMKKVKEARDLARFVVREFLLTEVIKDVI